MKSAAAFTDQSQTQMLLRQSVRKAKQKLQSSTTQHTPTPSYNRFDTFSSKGLIRECLQDCNSMRETFKRTEQEEPTLEYLREKNRQLLIENVGLKDGNSHLQERVLAVERELESTKKDLLVARQNSKNVAQDREAYRNSVDSMVAELHKELDLKKKIAEKYQAESAKYQQEKKEVENYCRQLANEYTVLLNSHSKQQQTEKQQGQRYQHRINLLTKQLSSIKNILLKNQHRQYTSRDRYDSRREEQLTTENLQLLKKIKSMKIEQQKLKTALNHANKEIQQMRKQEYSREQKLEKCQRSHQAVLHEVAKNGLTISHKMIPKTEQSRCHRKSQSEKKPKVNINRSKSTAGKENTSASTNRKRLLL